MYKYKIAKETVLEINDSTEGETIEMKIDRIVNNNEPIKDGAPIVYTERKDGVLPAYNVRTDRFEVAIDAMTVVSKTHQAKREERHKAPETGETKVVDMPKKGDQTGTNNDA